MPSKRKKSGMFYIGNKKIQQKEKGDNYIAVEMEDGSRLVLPNRMYHAMITTSPINETDLRDRRVMVAVEEVVRVLLDLEIKFSEIESAFQYTSNFLNDKLERASAEMWRGVMHNQFPEQTLASTVLSERTLRDLDNYLEGLKDEQKSEEKSSGSGE
jgi:hypothetical protein